MKQKVVIRVGSMNTHKLRSKALKITVGFSGVEGARFKGEEKDEIEVIGEGLDIVELTNLLRKCVGHADLLSVGPVKEEKKKHDFKSSQSDSDDHNIICYYPQSIPYYPIHHCKNSYQYHHDPYYCSIM
ncbi:heavy metal-associated isoprenylated plant protein 16-like [Prosopis cineraria]|uniref:heavy metal-associated isoprenylated plant protein 16-like n=1 Tax=Prosopis cineraria TaxID=364024 RepID=UPI002410815E|nr:heavy metal-associated isoprenylated plant protein 16-like [Prosopis cineraria]